MEDNKLSEHKLKSYLSSLKTELSFYKEKCLELQKKDWREQELKEELERVKAGRQKEVGELKEQIQVLKAFVNDISNVKDGQKQEELWNEEKEQYKAEIASLKEQLSQYEERLKHPLNMNQDSWFTRVLQEQNAIEGNQKKKADTFLSLKEKLDKE